MSCGKYRYLEDSSFSSFCSDITQEVLENNHTTTINVYKLNYPAIIFILCCFLVTIVIISLGHGKNSRTLKSPPLVIYDLSKTAFKQEEAELCIKLIKKENYDVNYSHPEVQLSLFLCACSSGNLEFIAFMLRQGANIHAVSKFGDSAFYLAVSRLNEKDSEFKILDILLTAGSDINYQNHCGFTALHLACSRGNMHLVQYLLQNGADPTIKTYKSILPHQLASSKGHADIVEYIAEFLREKLT